MTRRAMRRSLGSTTVQGLLVGVCGAALAVAVMGTSAWASTTPVTPAARAARTVSLAETAHLEFSKREIPGSEISESGRATGTYNAPVIAGLTIHAHSVTAIVTVFLKGGSITATANASFEFTGDVGNFHGTLTVSHATGTYRHASGHLTFRGAINRNSYKMWAVTSGSAKY
jgi:hypothetical protein